MYLYIKNKFNLIVYIKKALNMFRDCLNEDSNLAESYYYLGYMYEYGFGIT